MFDLNVVLKTVGQEMGTLWYDKLCDQTQHVLGHRPTETPGGIAIPPMVMIFNGPQPLYAHDHLQWDGTPLRRADCIHYAGVYLSGERHEWMIQKNLEMKGFLLMYVTDAQVRDWCSKWLTKNNQSVQVGEMSLMTLWKLFSDHHIGVHEVGPSPLTKVFKGDN
jgi:hypothetical protein